jgi:predicted ATPase
MKLNPVSAAVDGKSDHGGLDQLKLGSLKSKLSPIGRLASLSKLAQSAAALGPVPLYHHFISNGLLHMDCEQGTVVYKLAMLFETLSQGGCCSTQRGYYIYGSVGCGKTMAMDVFAAAVHVALPHLKLCRVHLNSFLEMVHSDLLQLEKIAPDLDVPSPPQACRFDHDKVQKPFNLGRQDDRGMRRTGSAAGWVLAHRQGSRFSAVERLAHLLAQRIDVLCLDEVAITNLQNCVVLGPLIHALCEHGVVLIATSNKAPHDLYEEGLDRDAHLAPFTSAISQYCTVLHHPSTIDYRKRLPAAAGDSVVFKWQCEDRTDSQSFIASWWTALSGTDSMLPVPVGYGRTLTVRQSQCLGCASFSFASLCTYPPVALGSADYAELCSRFHTVVVSDVPRLRPESRDAARRWTLFLDSCYENHIRLIMSTVAENPQDLLELSDIEKGDSDGQSLQEASYAVSRCTSRLHEMQSKLYQDACDMRFGRGVEATHP